MQNRVSTKARGDLSDYGIDWTEVLKNIQAGEEIQDSMWNLLSGDIVINPTEFQVLTLPGMTHDAHTTSVWAMGGTRGSRARLQNIITTNHGRVLEDIIDVEIQDIADYTLASRYTSLVEIENVFGRHNVAQWMRIEDDDVPTINARMLSFMEESDEQVDSTLLGGVLKIPFVDPVPKLIRQAATLLAGVAVYEARGIIDVNPATDQPMHRLALHKKRADTMLKRIRCGRQRVTGIDMIVKTHPVIEAPEDCYPPRPLTLVDGYPWPYTY